MSKTTLDLSFPYCTPCGSQAKIYVAPNRLISEGEIFYGFPEEVLLEALTEKLRSEWSQSMASQMANALLLEIRTGRIGDLILASASVVPEFLVPHVEQMYCGSTPLSGSEVSYEWPNGRLTSINKLQYGFFSDRFWIMYVRHEEVSSPGEVHHQLRYR